MRTLLKKISSSRDLGRYQLLPKKNLTIPNLVILGQEKVAPSKEGAYLFLIRGSWETRRSSGQEMLTFSFGKQSISCPRMTMRGDDALGVVECSYIY